MRLFQITILFLTIITVFASKSLTDSLPETETEQTDHNKQKLKLKHKLNDSQINAIINTVLQTDMKGKSHSEVKAIIQSEIQNQQKKTKTKPTKPINSIRSIHSIKPTHSHQLFHHVHKSTEEAEDKSVEEHVADDAIALGQKKGIFQMKHELNAIEDESEAEKKKQLNTVDTETRELQSKYETILKDILKEKNESNQPKLTQMELIEEMEKRMKEHQKTHSVSTSDRMITYLTELLRTLNDGTLKKAERFNMKRFVRTVFGKYKEKHEMVKERKRRIIALREHLLRMKREEGHHPNFIDEFYTPHERGFDANFHLRPVPPKRDPSIEPQLMTSLLEHPKKLGLSESDREKYFAYEHHSDHMHLPLNMPAVTPNTAKMDFLESLNLENNGDVKMVNSNEGIFHKIVTAIKNAFSKK